jgi:hypothetical protein
MFVSAMKAWVAALALLLSLLAYILAKNADFADFAARASGAGPAAACSRALPSLTPEQSLTQAELAALATQFFEYCQAHEELKTDPRVRAMALRWNKHVLLSDFPGDNANVLGSFNKASGCLLFRYLPQKSRAEQLGIVLHELAHTSGASHDDAWRDAFLFFANVATEKLGWVVTLKCPTVCKTYNICSRTQCPLCDWSPAFESCSVGAKL